MSASPDDRYVIKACFTSAPVTQVASNWLIQLNGGLLLQQSCLDIAAVENDKVQIPHLFGLDAFHAQGAFIFTG